MGGPVDDPRAPPPSVPSASALWAELASTDPPGDDAPIAPARALAGYLPCAQRACDALAPHLALGASGSELGAALLDAFSFGVGDGDSAQHPVNLIAAALAGLGGAAPTAAEQDALEAADRELALAHTSADLPDALGVHLASVRAGLPAPVRMALPPGSPLRDPQRAAEGERRAQRCLSAFLDLPREDAARARDVSRLRAGARRVAEARRRWIAALAPPPARSPREAMRALVRAKAGHARGYHGAIGIGGRSLDAWLADPPFDGLLDALASSPYVRPDRPDDSPLLRAGRDFGGPMFGVWDAGELAVVRGWIASLAARSTTAASASPPAHATAGALPATAPPAPRTAAAPEPRTAPAPKEWRALYSAVLRDRGDASTRARAAALVEARTSAGPTARALDAEGLWPYSPERLFAWVDARHRAQVAEQSPWLERALALVDKGDALWLLTQLAPAAFVDGAWLAGLLDAERLRDPAAGLLFRIYRDELGAGVPAQHHGNVLRDTLARAGVVLPACDDPAFAASRRFVDAAFALPALWLSLSLAGAERSSELYGHNLAVEIAGLGAGYTAATRLLRRHGIDPTFFVLHNSIDNPASGHTAWSARAIALHLSERQALGGSAEVERAWLRVWAGFASYGEASRALNQVAVVRLAPRLARRGLSAALAGARARVS